jgi:hypothetical protein
MNKFSLCFKKILLFLFLCLLIFTNNTLAQTATISASQKKQIDEFKEKIATKVAQLQKKTNNKAIAGFVEEISGNKLRIKTADNDSFEINVDSLITKYYQIKGSQMLEINFSELKKNQYIIASGLIDNNKVTANFIYLDEPFLVMSGKVTEVNKTEYYLKVLTNEKEVYLLDIETTTRQLILNIKTINLEKTGFSKIKEGDTIYFVIKNSKEKKERYSAEKILIIPQEYFIQ